MFILLLALNLLETEWVLEVFSLLDGVTEPVVFDLLLVMLGSRRDAEMEFMSIILLSTTCFKQFFSDSSTYLSVVPTTFKGCL